ncbi:quinol monooxygenase YgiN [Chromobacterium alkanivorans]|uniref:putative quinol monooxygenase n=1 Tax=Chromobacterium TaxID=535 RepID=UPI0006534859|nr:MULTISPECIES: putative quinol monooxygenase [Chromobacterium]KMN76194.1 hypothetical protein VK98_22140 [Chromobacterium sp. LK11]MCS3805753.1 quinol monooxygenase YgiN [Chromobacterium alkanivorans]MCS3820017.1 quinol monooxygenase YgiN [Chromobacterium alkanivorans]MCS3874774.1 quinol monooxygenase YgiN [Chromobacterium alkanivorans]
MHIITVPLTIKAEYLADYLQELSGLLAHIRREPDCLRFDVLQNADQPCQLLLHEVWSSRAYLEQQQLKRPYYAPYFARIEPMLETPRVIQHWRSILP